MGGLCRLLTSNSRTLEHEYFGRITEKAAAMSDNFSGNGIKISDLSRT
jgi:hypothetical protein